MGLGGRLTRSQMLGLLACVVGLLLVFGRDVRHWWAGRFQPRITFADATARASDAHARPASTAPPVVFEGEVYRTEIRLREMSAVALAAALTGLAAATEGRPVREVSELQRSLVARGLLPPGLTVAPASASFVSEYGTVHLRLRPQPFAVEVLAVGRERRDGPALLLRLPDEPAPQTPAGRRYFSSTTLIDVKMPAPFATPTAILACGWRAETLRPSLPNDVDAAQLEKWAQSLTPATNRSTAP